MRVPGPEPTSMTLDVLLRFGAASAIWSSLYSTTGIGCSPAVGTTMLVKQETVILCLCNRKHAAYWVD